MVDGWCWGGGWWWRVAHPVNPRHMNPVTLHSVSRLQLDLSNEVAFPRISPLHPETATQPTNIRWLCHRAVCYNCIAGSWELGCTIHAPDRHTSRYRYRASFNWVTYQLLIDGNLSIIDDWWLFRKINVLLIIRLDRFQLIIEDPYFLIVDWRLITDSWGKVENLCWMEDRPLIFDKKIDNWSLREDW